MLLDMCSRKSGEYKMSMIFMRDMCTFERDMKYVKILSTFMNCKVRKLIRRHVQLFLHMF
mgnify:CR=1 FL=1